MNRSNKPKQAVQLILLNKPYQVISQFSNSGDKKTLAEYIKTPSFYPAGRLDYDSEGLLLLTNNGRYQAHISDPKYHLEKTYWVQIEGIITETALNNLRKGVELKDGLTRPASARIIKEPAILWTRNPPIRERKKISTQWLELKIKEGKNRQVRRMTAAVGFPTLRLIRYAIGHWNIKDLTPGEHVSITLDEKF